MALLGDRVQETTTSTGTGTIALGGALTGYVTFNSTFSNGNVVWYVIDDGAGAWEIGYGTVGTGTLTRNVFQSSNANALVPFTAGTKRVFCTAPYTYFLPDQTGNSGKILTTDGTTPSWTSSASVSGGLYASGAWSGTYTDGIVIDYTTGIGRLTVGASDGFTFYNGGPSSRSALMTLDASGNLGVGTSTPAKRLSVVGGRTQLQANNEVFSLQFEYGPGTGQYYIGASNSLSPDLVFSNVVGSEKMRLTSAGYLGIGTSSPGYLLDVNGSARFSGATDTAIRAYSNGGSQQRGVYVSSGSGAGSAGGIYLVSATSAGANGAAFEAIGQRSDANGSSNFAGNLLLGHLRTDAAISTASSLGRVGFGGNPTGTALSNILYSAQIIGLAESGWSSSTAMPTALAFYTGSTGIDVNASLSDFGTERMRLTSAGYLGIGTSSPSYPLVIAGGIGAWQFDPANIVVGSNSASHGSTYCGGVPVTIGTNSGGAKMFLGGDTRGDSLVNSVAFYKNNTETMRLDSSGNLGIGVTPSTLWTNGGVLQTGYASFVGYANSTYIGQNWAYANPNSKYIVSAYAQLYEQNRATGAHIWYNAPSGTAGSTFSFTSVMTLDASGKLGVGTSSPTLPLSCANAGYQQGSTNYYSIGGFVNNSGFALGVTLGYDSSLGSAVIASAGVSKPIAFWQYQGSSYQQQMMLDGSGNLGLGVTPSAWSSSFKAIQIGSGLSLSDNGVFGTYLGANYYYNGTNNIYKGSASATAYGQTSGQHIWFTAPSGTAGSAISFTQAMTLDASGRLSIGATSASNLLTVGSAALGGGIDIFSTGSDSHFYRYSADGYPPAFIFQKSRAGAAVQSGDGLGQIYFSGYDGSSWQLPVSIWSVVTGPVSAGSIPSALIFGTSSTTYPTERARIDSSGNLLVGITATTGYQDGKLSVQGSGTNPAFTAKLDPSGTNNTQFVCSAWAPFTAGNNVFVSFETETTATVRGTISYNRGAGLVAYNTSSDQRLKTNIAPAGSAAQSILDFPVDQFDWIDSGNHVDFGAIAQKAINVIPEMVSVPADEDEMWGIDWSKAVPRLIRAYQELHAELQELKATLK